MEATFIKVCDKQLYVEIHGDAAAPPLLYLHGGPGEGCYEFMLHQSRRLSDQLRLIGIDQRGVWRSEEIGESEPLALEDLVEDCEQLRKELGIAKWSVLGHSFGGLLGVRYAGKYPDSVKSLILEGPSLDLPKSLQSWLRKAAGLYESLEKSEQAQACLAAAGDNRPPFELLHSFFELGEGLGELRMKVYTPNEGNNYTEMSYSDSETEEFGRRSYIHLSKLMKEGRMFDPVLPVLKELTVAVLLIKGRHDPITCEEQTRTFVENTRNGTLKIYEECGHLPHFEAPDRFAADVIRFVTRP